MEEKSFGRKIITAILAILSICLIFFAVYKVFIEKEEVKVIQVKDSSAKHTPATSISGKDKETPENSSPGQKAEKPKNTDSSSEDKKPGDNEQNEETENSDKPGTATADGEGKNIIASSTAASYDTNAVRNNMENSSYKGKKLAFLTFDDGVNTTVTNKVLDVLNEKGVHATFFIVGKSLGNDDNRAVLKRLYNEGHAIATHSYSHNYEKLYPGRKADPDYIVNEYKKSVEAMKEVLGPDFNTKVWRYPGGHMSWNKDSLKVSDKALKEIGVEWIDWNSMNGDAQPKKAPAGDISRPTNTQEVIDNFEKSLNFTANGKQAVVLMHDAQDKTLTANSLGAFIDHLKAKGYEFGVLK